MSGIFNGEWWTLRVPDHWQVEVDGNSALFFHETRRGTLQISAARNENGDVTVDDLRDFSSDCTARGSLVKNVQIHAFSGITCSHEEDGFSFKEWWLRYGSLMIYVTYVVESAQANEAEYIEVERILETLAAR